MLFIGLLLYMQSSLFISSEWTGCSYSTLSFSSYWDRYSNGSFWLDFICAFWWTIASSRVQLQRNYVHLRFLMILSFLCSWKQRSSRSGSHTYSIVDIINLHSFFFCMRVRYFVFLSSLFHFFWSLVISDVCFL